MSLASLTLDASFQAAFGPGGPDLQDIEAVRLILHGDSVVDWHKLDLDSLEKIDRFLGLHSLDLEDPRDHERLRFLHKEAVHYLEEHLSLSFPPGLRDPSDVRDVFLQASRYGGFRRKQMLACAILKLMHVINHMEAADLKLRTSVSEVHLIELAERRIMAHADRMRAEGLPVVSFFGSRKTRTSVITKLLVKTDAHATTIFDKLRFRVVTATRADILPTIVWLTRNVFPFNYVIPRQSQNNLLSFSDMVRLDPRLESLARPEVEHGLVEGPLIPDPNPFSGSTYRMINFIVDYPVQIDDVLLGGAMRHHQLLGRIVYVMVEFQILDQETARRNEEGENAHALYKARQRGLVSARLKKGGLGPRTRSRSRRKAAEDEIRDTEPDREE
ncbi:MAG: TIGR04552 family protein [Deltaproteobacteria bacterium]|nr:TIGR04552 family protein [Deltaproteobacteria bacterium]